MGWEVGLGELGSAGSAGGTLWDGQNRWEWKMRPPEGCGAGWRGGMEGKDGGKGWREGMEGIKEGWRESERDGGMERSGEGWREKMEGKK